MALIPHPLEGRAGVGWASPDNPDQTHEVSARFTNKINEILIAPGG